MRRSISRRWLIGLAAGVCLLAVLLVLQAQYNLIWHVSRWAADSVTPKSNEERIFPFFNLCVEDEYEEAQAWLKRDPEVPSLTCGLHDWTPLHMAAWGHNAKTARMLVDFGAEMNAKDKLGRTPLDCAIQFEKWGVAVYLLENGGELSESAKEITKHEIAELLRQQGFEVRMPDGR